MQLSSSSSQAHISLILIVVIHVFLSLLFLKDMHELLPLNRSDHDGAKASFVLVLFWYLAPIPAVFVPIFALNRSRAERHDAMSLGAWIWAIAAFTVVANVMESMYARVIVDEGPGNELQRLTHNCWLLSNFYTTLSTSCIMAVVALVDMRRRELDPLLVKDDGALANVIV